MPFSNSTRARRSMGILERLRLDTHELPHLLPNQYPRGYEPYPLPVTSDPSKSMVRQKLEDAYARAGGNITYFLLSNEAKEIYEEARDMLLNYDLKHPQNESRLREAIDFLNNNVTDH